MIRTNQTGGRSDPILTFKDAASWAAWLDKNCNTSSGVWLRIAKNGSDVKSVSMSDALDVALCYGWITGQAKGENQATWLWRFVPRSAGSIWSKINRARAQALIQSGRVKPPGLAAIELARQNGRWDAAYDPPKTSKIPADLRRALADNPRASEFFKRLDSANRYAVLFRLQTAKKAETRQRKIHEFVAMLEAGKTFHPQRRGIRKTR